ncbi:hypothetical protein HPB52_017154 [Rhipicephalus sanguineus]|uniref:Uncharacterized protein n=1 Tax=Rhipicephalus sanguineus TaxID=34632 RepID=A0A9D4TAX5_RHISA|nr:hypothetical protein HPB52_017154 [Rhipicephalus sanguineus]
MATAGVSRVRCGGGTSNRVQFNPAIDLEMLSYVRNANPFRDHRECTSIASKMQDLTNMPFTNRTVRERTYRLLERFAARDRVAIRRSGTEEEYGEREALLLEILDLARESGVTVRAPRRANMPSVRPDSKAPVHNGSTTASRKSAALARDDAAEMYFAESTGEGPCTDMEDSATHILEGTASCDDHGDITSIENMHEPPTIVPEEAVAGPVPEQLPFAFAPQLVFEVVEIAASYQQSSFLIA